MQSLASITFWQRFTARARQKNVTYQAQYDVLLFSEEAGG